MERRVADLNELFDLLDEVQNGAWISFGYVSDVKVNKSMPTKKIRNPQTNRMNTVSDFSIFNSEGEEEIGTVVKLTSYNIQYGNRGLVTDKYNEYVKKANPIRVSYGLKEIQPKENPFKRTAGYGKGGVEVYNGKKENLKSHTYFPQNLSGAEKRIKSTYYAVNQEGHIIRTLEKEQLKPYLLKRDVDGASTLRNLGVQDEVVNEYIQKILALKHVYTTFVHDYILWVAATTKDGDRFTYINPNLRKVIDRIEINPQELLSIASKRFNVEMNTIERLANNNVYESRNMKQLIRLTESDLHRIINESVNSIINEAFSDSQYAHLAGQANGALNSFGGKVKGFFNPKWKQRKKRQEKLFANQAVGDPFRKYSSTSDGDNNYGSKIAKMPGYNYDYHNGGTYDALGNSYNGNGFDVSRSQYKVDSNGNWNKGKDYGEKFSGQDVRQLRNRPYNTDAEYEDFDNVQFGNKQLNKAFQQGKEARSGKDVRTFNGTYKNGTGIGSKAFKNLK